MVSISATWSTHKALKLHALSPAHQAALSQLMENSDEPGGPVEAVVVSGAPTDGVPRLDRWLQEAALVDRSDSCSDFTSSVGVSAVGWFCSRDVVRLTRAARQLGE